MSDEYQDNIHYYAVVCGCNRVPGLEHLCAHVTPAVGFHLLG